MEKCLEEEVKKRNELMNFVKNQEALIDELEKQLGEKKLTIVQQENEMLEINEQHAKALDKLQEEVSFAKFTF